MKNEEQEAALQALSHAHHEELHRILMDTCHEGEGSALRTRLLELQVSLDEQQRVGAQVCALLTSGSEDEWCPSKCCCIAALQGVFSELLTECRVCINTQTS